MHYSRRLRDFAAGKIVDLAHVICGALVIGQLVSTTPWQWGLLAGGLMVQAGAYLTAFVLMREN